MEQRLVSFLSYPLGLFPSRVVFDHVDGALPHIDVGGELEN